MLAVLSKRVHDIAGTTRGVKVYLNSTLLKIKSFTDYVKLYAPGLEKGQMMQQTTPRWDVVVLPSSSGFQQCSFVNSIATIKGGTHVSYITDQIVTALLEAVKRKDKGCVLKAHQVKSLLFVFVNALIENPSFDSQSKETLNLKVSFY